MSSSASSSTSSKRKSCLARSASTAFPASGYRLVRPVSFNKVTVVRLFSVGPDGVDETKDSTAPLKVDGDGFSVPAPKRRKATPKSPSKKKKRGYGGTLRDASGTVEEDRRLSFFSKATQAKHVSSESARNLVVTCVPDPVYKTFEAFTALVEVCVSLPEKVVPNYDDKKGAAVSCVFTDLFSPLPHSLFGPDGACFQRYLLPSSFDRDGLIGEGAHLLSRYGPDLREGNGLEYPRESPASDTDGAWRAKCEELLHHRLDAVIGGDRGDEVCEVVGFGLLPTVCGAPGHRSFLRLAGVDEFVHEYNVFYNFALGDDCLRRARASPASQPWWGFVGVYAILCRQYGCTQIVYYTLGELMGFVDGSYRAEIAAVRRFLTWCDSMSAEGSTAKVASLPVVEKLRVSHLDSRDTFDEASQDDPDLYSSSTLLMFEFGDFEEGEEDEKESEE